MANIDRTKIVGASEVPAILGLDGFCSPLKLWGIKTGVIPADDLSENEAVEWGTRLERLVSDKFSEKHGVKLMAYKKRYVHPVMEFFSCELDNIIVGTDEIVEIKTVGASSWKQWSNQDELPAKVIAQVTAQMGLSGRKKAWVACLCGGQKYIEKEVVFDVELYSAVEKKVSEFWKMVKDNTPPMAIAQDNPNMVEIYPKAGELVQLVEEMNTSIGLLQQTKADIKVLENTKDDLEAKLKQVIGSNAGIQTPQYVVKWLEQESKRIDTERIKADGLFDKYSKVGTTRVMRVTLNKGGKG